MLPGRGENLYRLEEGLEFMGKLMREGLDLDELILADRFENLEKDLPAVVSALQLG